MELEQPVIRTYRAPTRTEAEGAYRLDMPQAGESGWFPVAHRWREDERGHELSVVFEHRPAEVAAGDGATRPVTGWSATSPDRWPEGGPSAALVHARSTLETLDLHCAGEPLRLVRTGFPKVPHAPVLERRAWVRENADGARRILMHEPRGHRDMYGAILLPPHSDDADICVLFMHNEGWSSMCGHGIIALTQALIEERLFPATEPVTTIRWETPAGLVTATAEVGHGPHGGPEVGSVRFVNVPAYLHARRLHVRPDGVRLTGSAADDGALTVDLAWGGAYYGIVDASQLGLRVVPAEAGRLRAAGAAVTEILRRDFTPEHPTELELSHVYGTVIVDEDPGSSPDGRAAGATIRSVAIFADAEVDRSPCGSGTSALLAQRHRLGNMHVGDELVNAGITGETFRARVEAPTSLGERKAILTSVSGRGHVTGYHTFVVDERDPLGDGFLLG
jgi:proline racemase